MDMSAFGTEKDSSFLKIRQEVNRMLIYKGQDLRAYIEAQTGSIEHKRDFVTLIEGYLGMDTYRGVLITGLFSTGKTVGILQAIKGWPNDQMIYVSPLNREEPSTKSDVRALLEQADADVIVVDEYSWIKDDQGNSDTLADYLAVQAQLGKKVFITGTDSCRVQALKNSYFLHREMGINTTYFSYDEYCRLYNREKCEDSMKQYLLSGGIFEKGVSENIASVRDYIQTAVVDNLVSYYREYDTEMLKAAIYTLFYNCIYNLTGGEKNTVSVYGADKNCKRYQDYLKRFGVSPSIMVPVSVMREISDKLQSIGVLVKIKNLQKPDQIRAYITSQAITAQLTRAIYNLEILPDNYIGHLYEASVVCNIYMKWIYGKVSPYTLHFVQGQYQKTNEKNPETVAYEINYIFSDDREACLFACRYDCDSQIKISNDAWIVKDSIPNLLGDRDVTGRVIFYRGEEKLCMANGYDILFTDDWNLDFAYYDKKLEGLQNKPGSSVKMEVSPFSADTK
jgi:hypothetical protein